MDWYAEPSKLMWSLVAMLTVARSDDTKGGDDQTEDYHTGLKSITEDEEPREIHVSGELEQTVHWFL